MSDITTKTARLKIAPAKKPAFRQIAPGLSLGYRRTVTAAGRWVVRRATGKGKNTVENLRTKEGRAIVADDIDPANGRDVMTFEQAQTAAGGPSQTGGKVSFTVAESFWNGRAFDSTIDTNEVLFSLFGDEIKAKLIARAMADFDDSTGLTTMQRAAAIKEAEEEIKRAEYLSEFWYREARKAGVRIGPRITSNPLPILDIEYV